MDELEDLRDRLRAVRDSPDRDANRMRSEYAEGLMHGQRIGYDLAIGMIEDRLASIGGKA